MKKRLCSERRWCKQGIRYFRRSEYEIIDSMKDKYPINQLCKLMDVNRSGYYKWKSRQGLKNQYKKKRDILTALLKEIHNKHKSYGYHRLAALARKKIDWTFSDNLVHKCCKYADIKSKSRHYKYRKTGEEHIIYPNRVNGKWNASKPLEIMSSDMTCIKYNGHNYEWTYLLDTYNNEIISHHLTAKAGDRRSYFSCLDDLKKKIEGQTTPVVLHTDQGAVYSSRAFAKAHDNCNIIRSMSRVGTPTDNPIIESING
ncbi:IS3 family transposase [Clostridium botulinum]|uniref:IS3 family transposase n=1 Tax=Clostridium botulinum TaxID=1491 RepID=UPI003A7FC7A5